jgi:hypothetical protein
MGFHHKGVVDGAQLYGRDHGALADELDVHTAQIPLHPRAGEVVETAQNYARAKLLLQVGWQRVAVFAFG